MKKAIICGIAFLLICLSAGCEETVKTEATDTPQATETPISTSANNSEILLDEPVEEQLNQLFNMDKDKVLEQLGDGYEIVPAGAEGLLNGYYYKDMGLTFVFDEDDNNKLWFVDASEDLTIKEVNSKMNFAQIEEKLGKGLRGEIVGEDGVTPIYVMRYTMENFTMSVLSFDAEGIEHVWIQFDRLK